MLNLVLAASNSCEPLAALLIFATLVDGAQSGLVEFDLMIKE